MGRVLNRFLKKLVRFCITHERRHIARCQTTGLPLFDVPNQHYNVRMASAPDKQRLDDSVTDLAKTHWPMIRF
jgi:hypothetical protein